MTTRKEICARFGAPLALAAALACVAFGESGCATPGPLHVYTIAPGQPAVVRDSSSEAPTVDVPDFLADGETITGFAYDPFTDHFFLRLTPGNRIRVVDRPARAVKREFKVAELSTAGGGDLAIRPRDGHVFALEPVERAVVEFTRLGEFLRRITLDGLPGAATGVAYDSARDRLLVLAGGGESRVNIYDPDGRMLATVALDRSVASGALGYDAGQRELYAPLAGGGMVGVFGEDGRMRRTRPLPAEWLDVGPRSFLRMF